MKNNITLLLAFASLALVGFLASPAVSFAEDRATLSNIQNSAAVGLFDLKTETDYEIVVVDSRPAFVYQTIADTRFVEYSNHLRQVRHERLVRSLTRREYRKRDAADGNFVLLDDPCHRLSAIRYLVSASSGARQ